MVNNPFGRVHFAPVLLVSLIGASFASAALADAPSGAIFTTVMDGSEVDANIYADKGDVYLDGGPGPGAPQGAAGLDDGTYVFQVTDPSGKTLLSQDAAKCREFVVSGGIITALVNNGCNHITGLDVDHGALTVQLMPYADTPNHGGEYKAWVVRDYDFVAGCGALGVSNGLEVVDCGLAPGNFHGFVPRHTKTDNYKVGRTNNLEIDTRFIGDVTGVTLAGRVLKWTDTLGGSNNKYSYNEPSWWTRDNLAHVEAVESGTHQITVSDQTGCKVVEITCAKDSCGSNVDLSGPGTVYVPIKPNDKMWTHYIYVYCAGE
jgi:membrane-bound inhibitor of C-type lysozyme